MNDPVPSQTKREEVGLPPRVFFYSLEQISSLLNLDEDYLRSVLVHFANRSVGVHKKDKILAINIAPLGKTPEWRVSEGELVRWFRFKKIKYYERGWATTRD